MVHKDLRITIVSVVELRSTSQEGREIVEKDKPQMQPTVFAVPSRLFLSTYKIE